MTQVEHSKLKLLVVDDESDNLDLLYRTFRREFKVFKADSGMNALKLLAQEGEMAIIISDQRMPGMNGTEFLSKTAEEFPDTIRILLTGYTDVEDLVEAINAGKVFKYITKPWNPDKLKMVVAQASDTYRVLKQRTDELHRALRLIQEQTEQMRAELAVARQIQSNLLRQELPVLEDVRIQACCHPAREVGGDFFEVYVHPQGDVWIGVGDVSGKGVPAALFMTSAISVLRRELSQEISPDPHHVVQNLNNSLSDDLVSSNCFITLALARYTPPTGELVYANAGHLYPLVWNRKQQDAEPNYLKVRGVPLGILPNWTAEAGSLKLRTGDVFLLSSDGITEATVPQGTQPAGSMLRQNGLWQLLHQQHGALDLDTAIAHIQAHNPVQEDDQTLLALEVL